MSRVTIHGLQKRFDGSPPSLAVDSLDLDIEEGEFLALLGPSGCGKTTTLRCVAGLESPDAGQIVIGDRVAFDGARRVNVRPDRRDVGMVFQSYALWPHMTVRRQLTYPLKARKQHSALHEGRVEEVARLVECDHLLDRLPAQLSGGQQQRVALARALVASPQVILFDEPLSNLDARLRDQMRTELHRIHRARPFTAIYVTHDQSEALALGQRIAIMSEGRLEQLGTPEEIFESPANEYVARFIGMANRLIVRSVDGDRTAAGLPLAGLAVSRLHDWAQLTAVRFGPNDARLVAGEHLLTADEVAVPVRVLTSEFGGRYRHFTVEIGDARLLVSMLRGGSESWVRSITDGDRPLLAFDPSRVAAFADPVDVAARRTAPTRSTVAPVGG